MIRDERSARPCRACPILIAATRLGHRLRIARHPAACCWRCCKCGWSQGRRGWPGQRHWALDKLCRAHRCRDPAAWPTGLPRVLCPRSWRPTSPNRRPGHHLIQCIRTAFCSSSPGSARVGAAPGAHLTAPAAPLPAGHGAQLIGEQPPGPWQRAQRATGAQEPLRGRRRRLPPAAAGGGTSWPLTGTGSGAETHTSYGAAGLYQGARRVFDKGQQAQGCGDRGRRRCGLPCRPGHRPGGCCVLPQAVLTCGRVLIPAGLAAVHGRLEQVVRCAAWGLLHMPCV